MRRGIESGGSKWPSAFVELLVVLAVSAAVLLPGIGALPVIDRDEARFAQASRQMLEAPTLEGWIVPRVAEKPRLNKPPLIYWLQAGGAWVATGGDVAQDAIWVYRLPSVLAAFVTAGLAWWFGRRAFGPSTGVLAGVLIGTCPLVVFDAHQARADEVLLAVTTAAQGALWWCWRQRDREGGPSFGATALFWVLVGLGALTKGPITPFVCCATAITLAIVDRRFRWLWQLRPWLGVVIVAAIIGPWIALVVKAMGWEAVRTFIDEEIVRRATTGVEGHWGPPGYHLVLLAMLFWPGSLLAAAAIGLAVRRGLKARPGTRFIGRLIHLRSEQDAEFFLLAWLVPSWIVFELAGTKLPHYVLPLYPALALLVARAFIVGVDGLPEAKGWLATIGFVLWGVLGLALAAMPLGLLYAVESAPSMGMVVVASTATVLGAIAIGVAGIWLRKGNAIAAAGWGIASVVISQATVLGVVLPGLDDIWISPRLMAIIERDAGHPEELPPIASQGYSEDSLVFLSRGTAKVVADAKAFLQEHPGGYVIVPKAEAGAVDGHPVGEVRGFDYSNGETYDLVVLRND